MDGDSIRHSPLAMDAATFRALGHRLVDQLAGFLESLPRGPVTRDESPSAVRDALDLTGPRLVRLSPNWAAPIPLPGEAAFLTFTENRYVPIPGSKKTANCSYMERWDEKLNKIRYARGKRAAVCYGASMYRPGLSPPTITIRRSSD